MGTIYTLSGEIRAYLVLPTKTIRKLGSFGYPISLLVICWS